MKLSMHQTSPSSGKSTQGSITIEAAISLPVFLLVLMILVRFVQLHEAEILWRGAGERMSTEVALVLSGMSQEEADEEASQLYVLLRKNISGYVLQERQKYWYNKLIGETSVLHQLIRLHTVDFERHESGYYIYVSKYSINIGPLSSPREYRTAIPVWSSSPVMTAETDAEPEGEGIWEETNFRRGAYFRERYGGNLPGNFRVLSGFTHGEAILIKSMDLTAPTWQNKRSLQKELRTQIQRLATFEPRESEEEWLGREAIQRRRLILVVPINSPSELLEYIQAEQAYAQSRRVSLDLRQDQVSQRYT